MIINHEETRRLLYESNPWWVKPYHAEGLTWRPRYLDAIQKMLSSAHAIVLAGPRRAGKTSILRLLIANILKAGKRAPFDIFYVSFDDPLLGGIAAHDQPLGALLEQFELIRKRPLDGKTIVVIDEIQTLPHWQLWVKKYYDQHKYKFIVSGSSTALVRGTFTELTGRAVSIEVFPLDFKEMVAHTAAVTLPAPAELSFAHASAVREALLPHEKEIKIAFDEYKERGGFPEVVGVRDPAVWQTILKNYFDQILYRDIVRMHTVKEVNALENLALYLLQNTAQRFSLRNIARSIDANVELVRTFLRYLEQSYLFATVSYYSGSLKTSFKKMKKVYCLDLGLRHSVVGHKGFDDGMVVENVVFHALRDRYEHVSYWYDPRGYELDFVARAGTQLSAFEVKYADHKLGQGDLKGLLSFLDKKKLDYGYVITRDTFKQEHISDKSLIFIPAWQFCLL